MQKFIQYLTYKDADTNPRHALSDVDTLINKGWKIVSIDSKVFQDCSAVLTQLILEKNDEKKSEISDYLKANENLNKAETWGNTSVNEYSTDWILNSLKGKHD